MKHFSKFFLNRSFFLMAAIGSGLMLSACGGNESPATTSATSTTATPAAISSFPEESLDSTEGSASEPAVTTSRADHTPPQIETTATANPPEMPEAYPTRKPASAYSDLDIVTLLPPDAILAIDNPRFLSAEEADQFYDPQELVMGVSFNGDSRAYSAPFLSNHEIVNDTVGGVKIAVTW
jgi:hypothetical protein